MPVSRADGAGRRRASRRCPRCSPASCGTPCSTAACAPSSSGRRSPPFLAAAAMVRRQGAPSPRPGSSTGRRCGAGAHPAFLTIVEVQYRDGGRERYVLPLAMSSGADAEAIEQQHPAAPCSRASPAPERACSTTGCSTMATCAALLATMRERRDDRRCATAAFAAPDLGSAPADGPADALHADHARRAGPEQHVGASSGGG